MKVAVIGSRQLTNIQIEKYLPDETKEIVSGGAKGVDGIAAEYARKNGLALVEIYPQYERYGRAAPLKRNEEIVNYADQIIAFWDGKSKGTNYVIKYAKTVGKPCLVIIEEK